MILGFSPINLGKYDFGEGHRLPPNSPPKIPPNSPTSDDLFDENHDGYISLELRLPVGGTDATRVEALGPPIVALTLAHFD